MRTSIISWTVMVMKNDSMTASWCARRYFRLCFHSESPDRGSMYLNHLNLETWICQSITVHQKSPIHLGKRLTNYLKCALFGKKKRITYNKNCHTIAITIAIGKESITYTNQYIKLNMFARSITVSVSQMCE